MTEPLAVDDLAVDYLTGGRRVRALDGADLTVAGGETVGVVGESGSGKSTLGLAVGGLLPPAARHARGAVHVAGVPIFDLPPAELRRVRRERLGFVFQDPVAALDPTMRVGRQLQLARGGRRDLPRVLSQLEQVRLPEPRRVARSYPHQLSGGMAQRVVIAIAMAARPQILVADEPTAALDSEVRAEVLQVVFALAGHAGTSILLLSHDLAAVGRWCARVAVMYGGRVVEDGPAREVMAQPAHPYTAALARSIPSRAPQGARLAPIPGRPPVLTGPSAGCSYAPRCAFAVDRCRDQRPAPVRVRGQDVRCHRAAELAATGALAAPAGSSHQSPAPVDPR